MLCYILTGVADHYGNLLSSGSKEWLFVEDMMLEATHTGHPVKVVFLLLLFVFHE